MYKSIPFAPSFRYVLRSSAHISFNPRLPNTFTPSASPCFPSRHLHGSRPFSKMSTPNPIPVILCGKSSQMAENVTKALLPEVEVIHVFLTTPSFVATAPTILSHLPSTTSTETLKALTAEPNIGSQNYSTRPLAVVVGAGFGDEDVKTMRKSVAETEGGRKVVWLRADLTKERPPLGPQYGPFVVGCVKECLNNLAEEGKLNDEGEKEGEGGVFYY